MPLKNDFLWVLIGRIVTAVIAILSLRFMTHLLAPADYGVFVLLMAFQGFCGLFLINPIGQHINRHTHTWWDEGTLLKRLVGFNKYLLAVSIFITLIVIAWWLWFPSTDKSYTSSILAALAVGTAVYLGTWNTIFVYCLNMLGFRSESVTWMTVSSVLGLIFSLIFTYQYRTAASWILGQVAGMGIGVVGAGLLFRRHSVNREVAANSTNNLSALVSRETLIKYCLPLAAATGLMWLQNTGYRFWVGGAWGVAELGILAIGLSISAQLWSILESLAMQFINPYFFRHIADAETDVQKSSILSDMINLMWPLYAVFAGFNILFASTLVFLLTDGRYHAATSFVLLGALFEFSRCTTNLWSFAAQIQRHTTKVILPYGLGALVMWLGTLGASYLNCNLKVLAITLVVSGIVTCLFMIRLMHNILPVIIDVKRWLFGFAIMIISILITHFVVPAHYQNFNLTILILLVGIIVWGSCMLFLLLHNPALKRMMSVSLRN